MLARRHRVCVQWPSGPQVVMCLRPTAVSGLSRPSLISRKPLGSAGGRGRKIFVFRVFRPHHPFLCRLVVHGSSRRPLRGLRCPSAPVLTHPPPEEHPGRRPQCPDCPCSRCTPLPERKEPQWGGGVRHLDAKS